MSGARPPRAYEVEAAFSTASDKAISVKRERNGGKRPRGGTCATALGCIRGEVELSTKIYLSRQFGIDSLDAVRFSTPLVLLLGRGDPRATQRARERIRRSSLKHGSRLIAVVAHADCIRFPGTPDEQIEDLCESVQQIASWSLGVRGIGLWIDETGEVDWLA